MSRAVTCRRMMSILVIGSMIGPLYGDGTPAVRPGARQSAPTPIAAAGVALSDLPVDFVENRGQWDPSVVFAARNRTASAAFERDGIQLDLGSGKPVGLAFEGAAPSVSLTGEEKRPGVYNFVLGNDPTNWHTDVPSYSSVLYHDIYNGIDVRVRQADTNLEYDVLVKPGAALDQFVIHADSTSAASLGADGSLVLLTDSGPLRHAPPVAWDVLPGGDRRPLQSAFRLLGDNRFGFEVTGHDTSLPLVVDPGIEWSTYLGGSGDESLGGMTRVNDGTGDVIIGGWTRSPEFPPIGGVRAAGTVFVARLSGAGNALKYATFFGGSNVHTVQDVAVDAGGNALVVGDTNSKDFPTTPGAFDSTPPGNPAFPLDFGEYDGYVIRFNATGGGPLLATYLGGDPLTGQDLVSRAGYDPAGNPIVAGFTSSTGFPTTAGAYDRTMSGGDVFVTRLTPDGRQVTYSSFLGGDGQEAVYDMVVGPDGAVNLTGQTFVPDSGALFPTTAGAFDTTAAPLGSRDREAFVARLQPDGAGTADLRYSTLLGGNEYIEAGNGIAIDPSDPTLITASGFTRSGDFPTTPGALLRTHFAPIDTTMGWVTRFRTPAGGGGSVLWSTLYGAPGNQTADDVVVDAAGTAIIVGGTNVNNPPTTERAFDRIPEDGTAEAATAGDAYVTKISADGSQILYSTLLGATAGEAALEVVDAGGNSVIVAGLTMSTDFPVTAGAFDTVFAADGKPSGTDSPGTLADDIFVTKLSLDPMPTADTTPPPAPAIAWPNDGAVFDMSSATGVRVALDWSDVADPSGIRAYHVQVSPNPEFRNDFQAELDGWYEPWSPTSFASYFYCCGFTRTYSWRVQALDAAGNLGPWSAVRTYRVQQTTSTALTAPVLTSPPNGGRYQPGSVIFAWDHVAGATSYTLEVDTTTSFNSANKITVSNVTTNRQAATLNGVRDWFWRVRAFNGTTAGPLSSRRSVQTRTGSPAPPVPPPGTPVPAPSATGTGLKGLAFSPELVAGSQSITGTVTLYIAAPAGGAMVILTGQYPDRLSVPASVTVPAGATSATFTANTTDGRVVVPTVIGQYGGSTQAATVMMSPAEPLLVLQSFALSAPSVQGGGTVVGTVALLPGFIPGPDGAIVMLASTNPSVASVPRSVTIPQGSTSATFTITTQPVTTSSSAVIVATRSSMKTLPLEVLPPASLSDLSFNPNPAIGTFGSTGTVTLGGPAPAGGKVVSLTSSDTRWATVPASVTVPAGATSANFAVGTASDPTQGQFSIIRATADGLTRQTTLNVNPPPPGPGLSSLSLNPTSVSGGTSSTGTVTVSSNVSACCVGVILSSSDPSVASVPDSVFVPVGSSSVQFPITTTAPGVSTSVTITATRGGVTRTSVLTVNPSGPVTLSAVSLNPTSVTGGNPSTGTVTLSGAAPAGGTAVTLSSSNTAAANVPASVTIPAGSISVTFTTTTTSVTASTLVTITAAQGGTTRTAALTVIPVVPVTLSAVSLNPTSVTGGNPSTGTVTLSGAAPAGGTAVTLSSSNTAAANVPASVTVPAGSISVTFTTTTTSVTASTLVTITAAADAVTRTATVTVNPVGTGPLPAPSLVSPAADARFSTGETITFDWSDVSGAATYTIQIDDQDTFASPLVTQTVTASTVAISTLPTTRMWWRVRANDPAGNPGAFTGARRFEIR